VLEILWQTSKSAWTPTDLVFRPQRWFTLGDDGRTLMIAGEHAGGDAVAMNPLNFLVHRVRAQSGFEWRTGLLRSCVRAFVVRMFSWKDWLAFAEVFGMPARIGRLREGVSWESQEARNLYAAVRALGTDYAAVIGEGNDIELLETKAGVQEPFEALIEKAGRELTLAILGQTLTSGGEGGGSYALGQVHNQVRWDLVKSDARSLERTLTEQLLRPLVLLNKGPAAPVPTWNMIVEEPEDLTAVSTTVETLGRAGLRIPASYVYEKFGIPEPEGDEEVLVPQAGGMGMMSNATPAGRRNAAPVQAARTARASGPQRPREAEVFGDLAEASGLGPMDLWDYLNQAAPPDLSGPLPEDALTWLGERRVVGQDAWDSLSPAGRQRSWWVTGLNQRKTALLARELMDVVRSGRGEYDFLDRLESLGLSIPEGQEAGAGQIPAWQARLVHRNNRFGAYSAARWQTITRDADLRPIVQHVCGSDPCSICRPYCGLAMSIAAAARIAGQLHHGCQCSQVSVSALEAEREGLEVVGELPDNPLVPEDWRYDRRDAYYLESHGGEPVTEAGRADARLLAAQPRLEDLLS
ncbi:MAG TPA: DUF935 family protein, partial [Vicinamibacterales bacterium]|nr:DUF935 family protein [Vicinamibacterales bacterium]